MKAKYVDEALAKFNKTGGAEMKREATIDDVLEEISEAGGAEMKREATIDDVLEEISEAEHEDAFNDLAKLRTLRENMLLFIWELREKSTKKLVYYDPYKSAMDKIDDAYRKVSEALDEEYMRNVSPKY